MIRTFLGTFALVFAAMLGLYLFDTFLARTEIAESHAEAQRLFEEGQALLREGKTPDAIERFRNALEFARNNRDYQLALSRALLDAGKLTDSEAVAKGLLERDPTDGRANLTMARVMIRENRSGDAEAYYHRAIYGKWPGNDAGKERLRVRLELIDLLARGIDKQALLAELLPLEGENLDPGTRERVAHLYLVAGSPTRAMEMFRQILRDQPSNARAFAGLGMAEFARGNYRGAHLDFLIASRLKPNDTEIKKQFNLASEVLTLDPTVRGLNQRGRYQRSAHLLELAEASLSRCSGAPGELVNEARLQLQAPARQASEGDATEANLDLAEKLWQARKKECPAPVPESDQALALVLTKIAQ